MRSRHFVGLVTTQAARGRQRPRRCRGGWPRRQGLDDSGRRYDGEPDHRAGRRIGGRVDEPARARGRCRFAAGVVAPGFSYRVSGAGGCYRPLADSERTLLRGRRARRGATSKRLPLPQRLAPPDNFQEAGDAPRLARRTSPTNIAMALPARPHDSLPRRRRSARASTAPCSASVRAAVAAMASRSLKSQA